MAIFIDESIKLFIAPGQWGELISLAQPETSVNNAYQSMHYHHWQGMPLLLLPSMCKRNWNDSSMRYVGLTYRSSPCKCTCIHSTLKASHAVYICLLRGKAEAVNPAVIWQTKPLFSMSVKQYELYRRDLEQWKKAVKQG